MVYIVQEVQNVIRSSVIWWEAEWHIKEWHYPHNKSGAIIYAGETMLFDMPDNIELAQVIVAEHNALRDIRKTVNEFHAT